jgi:hypothetical protein
MRPTEVQHQGTEGGWEVQTPDVPGTHLRSDVSLHQNNLKRASVRYLREDGVHPFLSVVAAVIAALPLLPAVVALVSFGSDYTQQRSALSLLAPDPPQTDLGAASAPLA